MKTNLPRELSPRAKKLVLGGTDEEVVALIRLGRNATRSEIEATLAKKGGKIRSWMEDTHLASIRLPASALARIAELTGITYVDVGGSMGPSKK